MNIDLAPGWQLRCPRCGKTKPYGKVGIRLGAASIGKRVGSWCTACRWFRLAIVEKVNESSGAETNSESTIS